MSLHEELRREERVAGPTDRGFGLTFAAVFGVLGLFSLGFGGHRWPWWFAAAALFGLAALLRPGVLRPLNRLWLRFGLLLHGVMTPLAMGLVFFSTVLPIGLALRALGKDPLRLRRDPAAASYWIPREPPGRPAQEMRRQF